MAESKLKEEIEVPSGHDLRESKLRESYRGSVDIMVADWNGWVNEYSDSLSDTGFMTIGFNSMDDLEGFRRNFNMEYSGAPFRREHLTVSIPDSGPDHAGPWESKLSEDESGWSNEATRQLDAMLGNVPDAYEAAAQIPKPVTGEQLKAAVGTQWAMYSSGFDYGGEPDWDQVARSVSGLGESKLRESLRKYLVTFTVDGGPERTWERFARDQQEAEAQLQLVLDREFPGASVDWSIQDHGVWDDSLPESKLQEQNGYVAMYNGQKAEIYADSLYAAKVAAIEKFGVRPNQEHMVTVMLAQKDGEDVTHLPLF
jgi:hypothetical protein